MSITRVLGVFATAILVVAGCTSTGSGTTPGGAGAGPSTAVRGSTPAGIIVRAASAPGLGTVLTGPNGMTLYTHAGDSATSSTCTGACATAWPPLATTGQPTAGAGLTGHLGTVMRADGTSQVTYGGLPLYYWQGDTKPGEVTGNGVEGFKVATVGAISPPKPKASHVAPAPAASSPPAYRY